MQRSRVRKQSGKHYFHTPESQHLRKGQRRLMLLNHFTIIIYVPSSRCLIYSFPSRILSYLFYLIVVFPPSLLFISHILPSLYPSLPASFFLTSPFPFLFFPSLLSPSFFLPPSHLTYLSFVYLLMRFFPPIFLVTLFPLLPISFPPSHLAYQSSLCTPFTLSCFLRQFLLSSAPILSSPFLPLSLPSSSFATLIPLLPTSLPPSRLAFPFRPSSSPPPRSPPSHRDIRTCDLYYSGDKFFETPQRTRRSECRPELARL